MCVCGVWCVCLVCGVWFLCVECSMCVFVLNVSVVYVCVVCEWGECGV